MSEVTIGLIQTAVTDNVQENIRKTAEGIAI